MQKNKQIAWVLTQEGYRKGEEVIKEKSCLPTRRTYIDGSSHDEQDFSTDEERKALEAIMTGALNSLNYGFNTVDEVGAILNTAEFIFMRFFPTKEEEPHINTYDTIYSPLMSIWLNNREEV